MATLAPGVLLKLIDGMNTGTKATREHRSSLLQVTDIVPANLDPNSLWPDRGFYLKVSDSSHSIYASLPPDQDDAVLSDKVQLGQFIYIDRLELGSPIPVIRGAKPIPGRHPVVSTPEPLLDLRESGRRSVSVAPSSSRRGSWGSKGKALLHEIRGSSPQSFKPIPLDFNRSSPAKGRKTVSPMVRGGGMRSSYAGGLLAKMEDKGGSSAVSGGVALLRQSCTTIASKFPRSRSVTCDRDARLSASSPNSAKNSKTPAPISTNIGRLSSLHGDDNGLGNSGSKVTAKPKSQTPEGSDASINLPGQLGILGKEAVQRRKVAQKITLRALREASATETIVRSLNMFSSLTKHAKAEAPATCFNQFLEFHQQMVQAVNDMVSIRAATTDNSKDEEPNIQQRGKINEQESRVLNDITGTSDRTSSKWQLALHKSVKPSSGNGIVKVTSTPTKAAGEYNNENDENRRPETSGCSLTDTITLGKEIEMEAGKWFMEFLEKALEMGLQKSKGTTDGDVKKVSQSLLLKVVNWVEVEQFDNSKQPLHPKALQIARKLRIKIKNP